MRQSCLGCIVEGFFYSGQVMVPNRFGDIIPNLCFGSKMSVYGQNDVFSMVGGLEGDCKKHIDEPKLFGMHSGSVLRGSGIINVNTDLKLLSLLVFWVENG